MRCGSRSVLPSRTPSSGRFSKADRTAGHASLAGEAKALDRMDAESTGLKSCVLRVSRWKSNRKSLRRGLVATELIGVLLGFPPAQKSFLNPTVRPACGHSAVDITPIWRRSFGGPFLADAIYFFTFRSSIQLGNFIMCGPPFASITSDKRRRDESITEA
jgi:hypothetical protein